MKKMKRGIAKTCLCPKEDMWEEAARCHFAAARVGDGMWYPVLHEASWDAIGKLRQLLCISASHLSPACCILTVVPCTINRQVQEITKVYSCG